MTISDSTIGERLRLLRVASDISQTDLATRIHLKSNGLISKLENGRASMDDQQIDALAAQLDCSPGFLRRPAPDLIYTRPWLRAYADASAKTVEAVTADNILQHEFATELDLRRIPARIPVYDGDLNDFDAIEHFAEEVRTSAEIEEGCVVGNAMRAAERLGCVILPLDDELGRHLGLSQYIDQVPYIRVSRPRSNVPGDRQRFTVAHELGHLSLHAAQPPPESADAARRIEQQAHRFAAAFLVPAGPLTEDLDSLGGRVNLSVLTQLKSRWGVAVKALVVRFQHLGIISPEQATSLYKQISKRGWNKNEPVEVSNEQPIWFDRALTKAMREAGWNGSAANPLGLGASHIRRWVAWEPVVRQDAEVVSLAVRRGRRGGS